MLEEMGGAEVLRGGGALRSREINGRARVFSPAGCLQSHAKDFIKCGRSQHVPVCLSVCHSPHPFRQWQNWTLLLNFNVGSGGGGVG